MEAENNKNLISKYIKGVNKRYLYRDIFYDERGINYTHFIKLRLTTFDKQHNFIEKFTPEGFRILWYLMTRAKQNTYITITIETIVQALDMTRRIIIKNIYNLINSNIIEVYNMKVNLIKQIKNTNEPLNILIKYHNDNLYNLDKENGYKAIPFDFAYKTVLDLDSKEFTLLMYLIVRNKYYYVSEYIDPETGEILKKVNEVCYSFPTVNNIANRIKVNQHNVNKYTQSLEDKGYIVIDKNRDKVSIKNKDTNRQEIKNMNYTYKVKLLNRPEYIKYHIVNVANEEIKNLSIKKQKYISSNKIDNILIECEKTNKLSLNIRNKLFLEQLYGKEKLEEYYTSYISNDEK